LIVLDASVLANAIGDDGADGHRARTNCAPPASWPRRTSSISRRRPSCTSAGSRSRSATRALPLRSRISKTSTSIATRRRHSCAAPTNCGPNLTVYDTAYVALAELLGCGLLTGDGRVANAPGPRCTLRLLT
jgi:hypothetical protein